MPCTAELLCIIDDTGRHRRLGEFAPTARVVHLLVSDFTVDFEDPGIVRQHGVRDRARIGVLGVGVEVHLDDPVA